MTRDCLPCRAPGSPARGRPASGYPTLVPALGLPLVATLFFVVLTAGAWAQSGESATGVQSPFRGRTVVAIDVKGNQDTARTFVLSRMRTKVGAPYSPDILDADVKRLFATGYFYDVETRVETAPGGVEVALVVVENLRVSRVVFEGRKRLQRQLVSRAVNLAPGSWLNPADLAEDARNIEALYRSKGYYHVSVTTDRKRVADGVDVFFRISEGPKTSVRNITITGNETFEEKQLKKILGTKESFWFLVVRTYDEDTLQEDVVNLRRFYRDEGFLDVQVDLETVELSEDKKHIDLNLIVEEGPRYTVRNVVVEGMDVLADFQDVVEERLPLKEEGFFRTEDLIKGRELIKSYYGELSYLFTEVGLKTSFAGATPEVDVTYLIEENDDIVTGLVEIQGNVETKDKVIRRDMEVYPNQRPTLSRLERSIARLKSRDYYESVDYIWRETDDPKVRDLVVNVREKPTGKIKFGAGITSTNGLTGEISIAKSNFDFLDFPKSIDDLLSGNAFTGAGQFFLIEVAPGSELTRARVSFQEPYLFDKPISLTTGASFFTRDREDYSEDRLGFNIALGRRLTRDIGLELGYNVEHIQIEVDSPFAPPEILDIEGSNIVSSMRLALGVDKRNNPANPTKGWRGGFTQELFGGPLGGQYDFYRASANYGTFFTLGRDPKDRPFVLAAGVDTSLIVPYGDTDETPIFERAFAGGRDIRGFDYRGIGPVVAGDPVGGDAKLTASVQFTFPIYEELLRGVVFADMGSVAPSYGDLFSTWRASAGAGLHIIVPFLGPRPLELHYAIPLLMEDSDDERRVGFSQAREF